MDERIYPVSVLKGDAHELMLERDRIVKCINADNGHAVVDNQLALRKIDNRLEALKVAIHYLEI